MRHLTTILLLVATIVIAGATILHLVRDNRRLEANISALSEGVTYYRTRLDASAASVARMQLTISELRQQHSHDVEQIRSLGLRLRRVQSYAEAATTTNLSLSIPALVDTTSVAPGSTCDSTSPDRLRRFSYTTAWLQIAGILRGDTLCFDFQSVDTLRQVVHRVPRKFLFFRFGTKGIRQEVWSSNPHTRLVYSEYIELKR